MEQRELKIAIPEGKTPEMTETTNGCVIEWVDKKKTFEDYARGYRKMKTYAYAFTPNNPILWSFADKMGLLKYIADDLNAEPIDWSNREQDKNEVYYDTAAGGIGYLNLNVRKYTSIYFTRDAVQKAIDIIPAEFLKTL